MVAISLYRGNLHKVPNIPRRWLMPTPKISLREFKVLLDRRSRALARLHSPSSTTGEATAATTFPNPNSGPNVKQEAEDVEDTKDLPVKDSLLLPPPPPPPPPPPRSDPPKISSTHPEEEGPAQKQGAREEEANDRKGPEGGDGSAKPVDDGSDLLTDTKPVLPQTAHNPLDTKGNPQDQKPPAATEDPKAETSNKVDALSDKEKRRKEIEEKLEILNAKKHDLVQVLKQILSAEEELKRRNSMQGTGTRPPVPLHVDVTNDYGSMTRVATPRLGSEGNLGNDMGGGEADDVSNHNMQSRHSFRTSSTSPSSESPHRRPAFSAVPHPARTSLAIASSPSRFAPHGHQSHPANLPTVSVSGTGYVASSPSPSPAASGGTSVFRDGRLPSPWN